MGHWKPSYVWEHAGLQVRCVLKHSKGRKKNVPKPAETLKKLPVFSCTGVISSTPMALATHTARLLRFPLSPAMTTTGLSYPDTRSHRRSLVRHLSTSDLPSPPVNLPARAWCRSRPRGLVWCGSMEDSRAGCQTQMSLTRGTQTLPKNFPYGLYQCESRALLLTKCMSMSPVSMRTMGNIDWTFLNLLKCLSAVLHSVMALLYRHADLTDSCAFCKL